MKKTFISWEKNTTIITHTSNEFITQSTEILM